MHRQIQAPQSLQKIVCFFYIMEHQKKDGSLQNLLPSNTEIMGWQYDGKWRVKFYDKAKNENFLLPDFYTTGQQTLGYNLSVEGESAGIMGAALQPGTLWQIFKKPVADFKNSIHLTYDIFKAFNANYYLNEYTLAGNETHRLEVMIAFYEQLMSAIQWKNDIVFDVVNFIFKQKGALKVADILEIYRLNEKYLQRNFKKIIGTTASEFIRNVRFANVFTQLSLSEKEQNKEFLAMLYNYYDFSHFQKDYQYYFRNLPSKQLITRFLLFRELVEKDPYLLQSQKNFER